MITRKRVFISCLFYVIVLVWIISFKMNMEQPIFECMYYFGQFTLKERFMMSLSTFKFEGLFNDWKDFLVNMCFFMPLGVYCFELMKKHSFLKGLGIAFLLTLVLETVQLITTVGYFTFNDLVSNTLGYVIGYLIYFLMNRLLNKKVIFYIFNAFTVFFAVLAAYGVVNTLINIEIYSLDYYL
jgi:glycopeptide antibiotics resistance protein